MNHQKEIDFQTLPMGFCPPSLCNFGGTGGDNGLAAQQAADRAAAEADRKKLDEEKEARKRARGGRAGRNLLAFRGQLSGVDGAGQSGNNNLGSS